MFFYILKSRSLTLQRKYSFDQKRTCAGVAQPPRYGQSGTAV
jgi:hypothetical protein